MKIQPIGNYILLEDIKEENKVGLILPEGIEIEESKIAQIIAVGEESKLKVGQRVMFKHYGFEEIAVDNKKYKIGKEESIIAIVK